jgi:flagellar basal body-associated protein FliL
LYYKKKRRNSMEEPYQGNTYQDEYYYEPAPKKGMSGWLIALIIVLVLIVVCCLCICLAIVVMGPAIGNTFSTIIETLEATTPVP